MIGLLIKSEDIDLYKWEFEYKSRRREMTEDERIKEDVEMTLHIKTENEKMFNNIKYRQELRDFPNKIIDGIHDDKFHILCLTIDEVLDHLPKL